LKLFRRIWFNLLALLFLGSAALATVPTISGFVTQVDGNTVNASLWNSQIGAIYTYINTNLVATWNKLSTVGGLLTYDGTNVQQLTPGANGTFLTADNTQAYGIKWATIANTTALTTKGDVLTTDGTNLQRVGVGTDGQVLTARSSATYGIDWENNVVPSGLIAIWSGTLNNIPAGWELCNGTNGTPNLQGLFVVGAGSTSPAASGGMGLLNPGGPFGNSSAGTGLGPTHTHSVSVFGTSVQSGTGTSVTASVGTTSGGATVTPRYYALAFVEKI